MNILHTYLEKSRNQLHSSKHPYTPSDWSIFNYSRLLGVNSVHVSVSDKRSPCHSAEYPDSWVCLLEPWGRICASDWAKLSYFTVGLLFPPAYFLPDILVLSRMENKYPLNMQITIKVIIVGILARHKHFVATAQEASVRLACFPSQLL